MGYFAFSERHSKWLRRLLPMNKRGESSIETTADGGWSAADPDGFETRPTDFTNLDHPSCSTTEMDGGDAGLPSSSLAVNKQAGRNEAKQTPTTTTTKTQKALSESTVSSPAGPSRSVVTVSPLADTDFFINRQVSLAPRGSVFRYFGADNGSALSVKTVHSTNANMFNSGVDHNPTTHPNNVPVVPPPISDRFIPIDPPLLALSSSSNSPSTVDSRCSSLDYIHSSTYEVPVTPPTNTEITLYPPVLARRGLVFAYFDLDNKSTLPALSLSENSFHTPPPRRDN